jgi:hypothetical protein
MEEIIMALTNTKGQNCKDISPSIPKKRKERPFLLVCVSVKYTNNRIAEAQGGNRFIGNIAGRTKNPMGNRATFNAISIWVCDGDRVSCLQALVWCRYGLFPLPARLITVKHPHIKHMSKGGALNTWHRARGIISITI